MSFDPDLSRRVREVLSSQHAAVERKMMGALCFMVEGHMVCGVTGSALMVRPGPDEYHAALAEPGVRPMLIGGRPTVGFVLVDQQRLESDLVLERWVQRGLEFATTLLPKRTV